MIPRVLSPSLDLLRQEYVLVQAWKKTASHIRYHNWYSDTLKLDWTTVNLPTFIADMAKCLESPHEWKGDPLRLVPAPKRQRWGVRKESGKWEPKQKGAAATPLRPLAHVSIRDQVVATALMLCLANRVETKQGDSRSPVEDAESRKKVSSYGNRLFCDVDKEKKLHHRWGSSKLYRSYSQDYRSFISRPALVAETIKRKTNQRVFIVESDLSQFYDRVRPDLLMQALRSLKRGSDDPAFFDLAARILNWRWHERDAKDVADYAKSTKPELKDFTCVALPQGLVSAGFFANVVLLAFDESLRSDFNKEIVAGIRIYDACRYVDDLRVVVTADQSCDLERVEQEVAKWLLHHLNSDAHGLLLSRTKTKAAEFGRDTRPFVRQSIRMKRIQSAVSGGFDAIAGQEILDGIQGLMRSQRALSRETDESGWQFSPVPDVRDETVARFSAARFRTTFRSIRPLLEDTLPLDKTTHEIERTNGMQPPRSKQDLDEDARAFSLGLIERWVEDPSNVRLLRIGFDIWPDAAVLKAVLGLLRPFTEKGMRRGAPRRVAWYCLAELLRAGATETGFVADSDRLPENVDAQKYREVLRDEATRLIGPSSSIIPWYLQQQALLFLAVFDPCTNRVERVGRNAETREYQQLILYMKGQHPHLPASDLATLAVLSRRSFSDANRAIELARSNLKLAADRKGEVAARDPSFALELGKADERFFNHLPNRIREELCVERVGVQDGLENLVDIVFDGGPANPLRNELSLLRFAAEFLKKHRKSDAPKCKVIAPGQVSLKLKIDAGVANIGALEIGPSQVALDGSLYDPPKWCDSKDLWRFQLGFLLRFILSGRPDFTMIVRPEYWKDESGAYRPTRSHWYQRLYGLFNGQQAFGDDWVPITEWIEALLLALLRWPGCRLPNVFDWVAGGVEIALEKIEERIQFVNRKQGPATGVLVLPMMSGWPDSDSSPRPLRACVVQTIIPDKVDPGDLTSSAPGIRRKHRNHLSAAIEAVRRMLNLRYTHKGGPPRLDWLILPELAVHPKDVKTHLEPFARQHKTLILAGLTYQEVFPGKPAINSALWIMPEWTNNQSLQIRTRRQCKKNLAPDEQQFNVQGFRPCQWLVGYPWSKNREPLWLPGSVCYDATDLRLVSDLRDQSDVFAIPAFNKDVKTFDQMTLALHYHMFQLVVVANNGKFGGSNAYWPITDSHKRQVFHLHGQPQASIAFLEIEDIADFLKRGTGSAGWKHPPAGWSGLNMGRIGP